MALGAGASVLLVSVPASAAPSTTAAFGYTGDLQTFTVPDGVTKITATVNGAAGGPFESFESTQPGKRGGRSTATLPVTPGSTLTLLVGQHGVDGYGAATAPGATYGGGGAGGAGVFNGGSGGGGSFLFGPDGTTWLVAGGGGGFGVQFGGGQGGGAGADAVGGGPNGDGPEGGGPGTADAPGAGGRGCDAGRTGNRSGT